MFNRPSPRFVFVLCTAVLLVSATLNMRAHSGTAQTGPATGDIDSAIVSAFKWRSIGPLRGGRSIAVSGVKGRTREAYFGAVGGGLWKTVDGGLSWSPVTD